MFFVGNKSNKENNSLLRHLKIRSLDVSQPFDYESIKSEYLEKNSLLKIYIVRFGNFGHFLAKTLIKKGHTVLPHFGIDIRLIERWEFLSSRM
jgi:arogenate dehydrogenase (NADP+)